MRRHKVAVPGKWGEHKEPMTYTFSSIPKTVEIHPEVLLTNHFYTSFLQMNSFTGRSALASRTIQPFLESSPALANVALAISSMLTQRKQSPNKPPRAQSIQFYRNAVTSLQTDLKDQRLNYNHSVLWSTFFLGLFEVRITLFATYLLTLG